MSLVASIDRLLYSIAKLQVVIVKGLELDAPKADYL